MAYVPGQDCLSLGSFLGRMGTLRVPCLRNSGCYDIWMQCKEPSCSAQCSYSNTGWQVPVCIYFGCIYFQHDGHPCAHFITFLSESFQGTQSPRTGRLVAFCILQHWIRAPHKLNSQETGDMSKHMPVMRKITDSPGSRTTPFTVFTQKPAKSGLETCLGIVDRLSEESKQAMKKTHAHSHQRECL